MWFKIKATKIDNDKNQIEYYLTEAINFAYAGYNVLKTIGNKVEIEDVQMLKQYKPAVNEYKKGNKIYIIKVAEDMITDDGSIKTIKYPMPAFANNDSELYNIIKDFLKQGLSNMRLTTISETKWIYIPQL